MEAQLEELHEAIRFEEGAKTQIQDAERTLSGGLSSIDRQIANVARRLSSSETKCDELESMVTANVDSVGLRLSQDAGRLSEPEAKRSEFLEVCRSAEDTDESEGLRQARKVTCFGKSMYANTVRSPGFVARCRATFFIVTLLPSIGVADKCNMLGTLGAEGGSCLLLCIAPLP